MSEARAALLDVNLLVALAWPNHIHHERAHRWFAERAGSVWATCSFTQAGFVRVSSNRKAIPAARTPLEALELLRRMVKVPGHRFWMDDVELARLDWVRSLPLVGYRQVTDLHLLALARARGGRLATLDRGIAALIPKGAEEEDLVELVVA